MNFYDTSLFQVVSIILFINVITGAPNSLNTILQSSNCQKNVSIAIIGAGFAGLAASKKLRAAGFQNVDIFEAENRIGGRVYPIPIADGFLQQGAEYINGQANPIYEIASRLGVVDKEVPDYDPNEDPDYWSGKCNIPDSIINSFDKFTENLESNYEKMAQNSNLYNVTVGELYEKNYQDFLNRSRPSLSTRKIYDALSRFYMSYYEAEWAAPINKLALQNFDQWDDKTGEAESFLLNKIGFKAILDEISHGISKNSIFLNSKVVLIDYRSEKSIISLEDRRTFAYDYVIVTVPLGHLKQFARQMFLPSLPSNKLAAIDVLGFGSNLKVFMVYDKPFWSDPNVIVPLYVEDCAQKSLLAEYIHVVEHSSWNNNVLVIWFVGKGPEIIGQLNDDKLNYEITSLFQNSLQDFSIPRAQKVIRTSWITNPNFYGSYSYITPEASKLPEDAFALIGRPISVNKKPRILFAGEATHSTIYQTTIGAYLSGNREADRLIKYLSC